MGNLKSFGVVCSLTLLVVPHFAYAQKNDSTWKVSSKKDIRLNKQAKGLPQKRLFDLDLSALKDTLRSAPQRFGSSKTKAQAVISDTIIALPKADGKQRRFRVYESSVMDPKLAAKYPEIKSYYGVGVEDPSTKVYFSESPLGLKAMTVSPGKEAEFIEPLTDDLETYTVFKASDQTSSSTNSLKLSESPEATTSTKSLTDRILGLFQPSAETSISENTVVSSVRPGANDGYLRTYRLAVSTNVEYANYFGGTKALALAAINGSMTLVNAIFERDLGVRLVLVANNDAVVYVGDPSTDPYGIDFRTWGPELQSTLDSFIGNANYDIGHFFVAGGGGGSAGGRVCATGSKGSGYSGISTAAGNNSSPTDLEVIAHEMGHQLGATHTWGTVEPGTGTSLMSYGGSQPFVYFNASSIQEVTSNLKENSSCGTLTPTGNAIPVVDAGPDYTIPKSTPFALKGTASDADAGDALTYTWEGMDLRDGGRGDPVEAAPAPTNVVGSLFRSFPPVSTPTRYFPRMSTVLAGTNSLTVGSYDAEVLPSVARNLSFRFTVRDNHVGGPANNSDDVVLTVTDAAGPFNVTAPNTPVTYPAGSVQTIAWDVAGTTANGVNAANVDILLSTDGGKTFPTSLASATPNDGSESITVPNSIGSMNRIMIRGTNHIFFDVSNTNFAIASNSGDSVIPTTPTLAASGTTASSTTLSWSGATDNIGVTGYDIYQNDVLKASTASTSITIPGLAPSTYYKFTVMAKDAVGNRSFASNVVSVTTLPLRNDTIAPTAPVLTASGTTPTSTRLAWTGATDNEAIAGYRLFTNGATTYSTFNNTNGRILTPLTPATTYSYYIKAVDASGNLSPASNTVSVTTPAADTIAPTSPAVLSASGTTKSSTSLSWAPSTDNVGVAAYDVYMNGVLHQSLSVFQIDTRLGVSGLTAGTSYTFYVIAKDAAGNSSARSNTVTVTTSSDTSPPTAPVLSASGVTSSSVNLSWSAATDNVGVTGYLVTASEVTTGGNSVSIPTSTGTSTIASGLRPSTQYRFYVRALDAAGNSSSISNYATVTTSASTDNESPTAPTSLIAVTSFITSTSMNLRWGYAFDNTGVTSYDVYQDGVFKKTVTGFLSPTQGYVGTDISGLAPFTSYSFYVVAKDAAGNTSLPSNTHIAKTLAADLAPPTAPTLTAWSVRSSQADLYWSTSTDDVGVTAYDVYQNGTKLYLSATQAANTKYTPYGLSPSTTYTFYVIARDKSGKSSPASNTVTITTLALSSDTSPPSMPSVFTPGIFTASGTTSSSTILSWSAGTDNVGITRYDIYQDERPKVSTASTAVTITGLTPSTTYSFRLVAWDAAGNSSLFSNLNVTTPASGGGDTTAPSAPSLSASGTTSSATNLFWSGATDAVGVTGYDIYQNGVLRNSSTGTNAAMTALSPSTTYSFYVIAKDATGNRSVASNTVSVTTLAAADTTAPTAPTLAASGTTSSSTNLSWSGATDSVGVSGYDVYQNGSLKTSTSSTSLAVSGLSPSTSYSFYVIAKDAAGNRSVASNTVSVTTLAVVVPTDTTAPSAATLTASGVTSSSTNLFWSGATDAVGVTGYDIYQNGVLRNSSNGTNASITGLSPSTTYSFYVIAKDAAGNRSVASNTVSITTLAPIVVGSSLTVTLTVPATAVRRSMVTFSATASVTSGTVSRVEFYVAGSLVCADATAAYSCSWKAPNAAKTVTVEARAFDSTGAQKSAFQTMQVTR